MSDEMIKIIRLSTHNIFNPELHNLEGYTPGEKLIVDLNFIRTISSVLMGFILSRKEQVVVINVSKDVMNYFQSVGVHKIIRFAPSIEVAEDLLFDNQKII